MIRCVCLSPDLVIFALAFKWYPASLSSLEPLRARPMRASLTGRLKTPGGRHHPVSVYLQMRSHGCLLPRGSSGVCGGDLQNDTEGRTESFVGFIFHWASCSCGCTPLFFLIWTLPRNASDYDIKRNKVSDEMRVKHQTWNFLYNHFFLTPYFPAFAYHSKLSTVHLPHTCLWNLLVRKKNYPVGCSLSFAFYTVINLRTSEREG